MDAIKLIKDDHRKVERLFKEFEGLGHRARKSKMKLLGQIIDELKAHTRLEEAFFYPALRECADAEGLVLEAYEEHEVVNYVIAGLESIDADHERFDARVTVLGELVQHHVDEEEKELLPRARKLLGEARLKEMGERMREARQRGTPEAPLRVSLIKELPIEGRADHR